MKSLKFEAKLIKQVLSLEKTTTWRFWDNKNLQNGDRVSFTDNDGKVFAIANLIDVTEKRLRDVSDKDWSSHESFSSNKGMYQTYSNYYGRSVDPNTLVKVIRFKLT